MNRLLKWLAFVVAFAGLTSTILFVRQGGFGAGHGRFDRTIGMLGFPWVLLPWPDFVFRHDFIAVVLLPFVINVGIIAALIALRRHLQRAG